MSRRPHRDDLPSPRLPMRTWAAYSVLCFIFSLGTFYGLSLLKIAGVATEGLTAMYAATQPFFSNFFRLIKLEPMAAHTGMSVIIYTVLQAIGLRFLIPALQQKASQISALERALGPVTRPVHRLWLMVALITACSAYALTALPAWPGGTPTETAILNLLRIGMFAGCAMTSFGTALIGLRLRNSWKKFKAFGTQLRPSLGTPSSEVREGSTSSPTPADYAAPALADARPEGMDAANVDESVFIALAAELVETAGRTRALPHYQQLEMPLLELQQAAAATHTGQFQHADLRGLCQQACDLLASGKLSALPNLNAARTAYERRDPSLYVDLASELRQKIKG